MKGAPWREGEQRHMSDGGLTSRPFGGCWSLILSRAPDETVKKGSALRWGAGGVARLRTIAILVL